jgi:hypothetical protein
MSGLVITEMYKAVPTIERYLDASSGSRKGSLGGRLHPDTIGVFTG